MCVPAWPWSAPCWRAPRRPAAGPGCCGPSPADPYPTLYCKTNCLQYGIYLYHFELMMSKLEDPTELCPRVLRLASLSTASRTLFALDGCGPVQRITIRNIIITLWHFLAAWQHSCYPEKIQLVILLYPELLNWLTSDWPQQFIIKIQNSKSGWWKCRLCCFSFLYNAERSILTDQKLK